MNLGARQLVEWGLPDGFATRLSAHRIGARFTLHVLARTDLVALKFFAAADDMGSRQDIHRADLRELNPTVAETASAIKWIEGLPDPHGRIRVELERIVQELGHEDLAYYISAEDRFRDALLSVLCAQWRSFGVPLHSELSEIGGEVVDPEALIWTSLEFFDQEPRHVEGAAAWVTGNRSRIIGQRITNLIRASPKDPRRSKWKGLLGRHKQPYRSARHDGWPSHKSIGRQHRDSSALLLRTRDVLGNDCRLFLIVCFLGSERGIRLRDVATLTGYSYRSVADAASGWELADIARVERGHAVLSKPALWRELFRCQADAVVPVNWCSVFQSSIELLRTLARARENELAPDHALITSAIRSTRSAIEAGGLGADPTQTPTLTHLSRALGD